MKEKIPKIARENEMCRLAQSVKAAEMPPLCTKRSLARILYLLGISPADVVGPLVI